MLAHIYANNTNIEIYIPKHIEANKNLTKLCNLKNGPKNR